MLDQSIAHTQHAARVVVAVACLIGDDVGKLAGRSFERKPWFSTPQLAGRYLAECGEAHVQSVPETLFA